MAEMKKKVVVKAKSVLPFKDVLQRIMLERGLTPVQVGALAGVSRSVVADWISGAAPRDLVAIGSLARALGLSMRQLLLDEAEESEASLIKSADPLDAFEAQPFLDGVFRVSFQRLTPKEMGRQKRSKE